jgi:hypothetical protein
MRHTAKTIVDDHILDTSFSKLGFEGELHCDNYFCELRLHAKLQNPRTNTSGRRGRDRK